MSPLLEGLNPFTVVIISTFYVVKQLGSCLAMMKTAYHIPHVSQLVSYRAKVCLLIPGIGRSRGPGIQTLRMDRTYPVVRAVSNTWELHAGCPTIPIAVVKLFQTSAYFYHIGHQIMCFLVLTMLQQQLHHRQGSTHGSCMQWASTIPVAAIIDIDTLLLQQQPCSAHMAQPTHHMQQGEAADFTKNCIRRLT